MDDVDLEGLSNNLKSHRLLDRSDKILDSVGLNDTPRRPIENGVSSYKRKALKVTFDGDADDLDKWTPIDNQSRSIRARQQEEVSAVRGRREDVSTSIRAKREDVSIRSESSAAAARARQTKERISDIEEEMAAMAEKQAAREARVARLRALVAETEQESEALELAQAQAERRSARREMLQSQS